MFWDLEISLKANKVGTLFLLDGIQILHAPYGLKLILPHKSLIKPLIFFMFLDLKHLLNAHNVGTLFFLDDLQI